MSSLGPCRLKYLYFFFFPNISNNFPKISVWNWTIILVLLLRDNLPFFICICLKHLKMAIILYLEVLTKALYQNIPIYYWYIVLHCHSLWLCVSFFLLPFSSCYFLLPFSQEIKMCTLFALHYFCNSVCTAFFLLRPFSICFAIEVKLELSFLLFWHVILDLLLKFVRRKWELPHQGLSSEKHVTSTERHFSTCCFKMLS